MNNHYDIRLMQFIVIRISPAVLLPKQYNDFYECIAYDFVIVLYCHFITTFFIMKH